MKYYSIIFAIIFANFSFGKTISIKEFTEKNWGTVEITPNENSTHYHSPLVLKVLNKTNGQLKINVPVGFVFEPENEEYQKFMVTEERILVALPFKELENPIKAMCINQHKMAPSDDLQYLVSNHIPPAKALDIAEFVNENKYFEPSAQFLLWDILKAPEEFESVEVFKLLDNEIMPMERDDDQNLTPFYAQDLEYEETTSVYVEYSGSFNMNLAFPKNIHIAMFDTNNILVKELYKNPNTPKGKTTLAYAFNSEEFEDDTYYIKVVMEGNVIMQRDIDLSMN